MDPDRSGEFAMSDILVVLFCTKKRAFGYKLLKVSIFLVAPGVRDQSQVIISWLVSDKA